MPYTLQATSALADPMRALLRAEAAELILGTLLVAVGVGILVLYASRREAKDRVLLAYAGFSGLYGLRLLAEQTVTGLVTGTSDATLRSISAYITYVILIPAFGFWEQMLGRGWKSLLRIMVWVTVGFGATALILDRLAGARGALMVANNVIVLVGLAILVPYVFLVPRSRLAGLGALRFGVVIFAVFALGENLAGLGLPVWPLGIESIGFFAFSGCLGYAAAQRVAANERKLLAVEAELAAARRIQSSILPERVPTRPGLDVATRYLPASSVAGDFYDFLNANGRGVGILVADVAGHGVPAALVASMVKVALSAQAAHARDPAAVLDGMNRIFSGHGIKTFITAGYVYLDTRSRAMRYAGAGHPPLLLWRGRERRVHAFRENGMVLGPFQEVTYANAECALEPGDRLVLYTDGITEAPNAAGELFGEERLGRALLAHAGLPAGEFADALLEEVSSWSGPVARSAPRDDLTLIVVDVRG